MMMKNLLEDYLNEVAQNLSPLPMARRNEELKEIRQHLLNAVIVNREMGQSEDEASANAVEQFGAPDELGASLVHVWRRQEQRKNTRRFWLMAAFFVMVFTLEGFLRPHIIVPFIPPFAYALIVMGWKRLTPQAAPAWWAYQQHPTTPAQCWLATARNLVIGLLLACAGMSVPVLHLSWAAVVVFTGSIWLKWYWDRRRGGTDGPFGVA